MSQTSSNKSLIPDSGHWHHRHGPRVGPVELKSKPGEFRPPTLRDARVHCYYPSTTTAINKTLAKPGLELWKQGQVIESAATMPRLDDESDVEWIRRVFSESKDISQRAASLGTRVHARIAAHLEGKTFPESENIPSDFDAEIATTQCATDWLDKHVVEVIACEHTTACPDGYGGTYDLHARLADGWQWLIDFKTQSTKPDKKMIAYDEYRLQLGAYARLAVGPEMAGLKIGNLIVSTTEPGRLEMVEHDDPGELYRMFLTVLDMWFWRNNFYPTKGQIS